MVGGKAFERPHESLAMAQRTHEKIEDPNHQEPQDDMILTARTGKQPVLKVCTLRSVLDEILS